MMPDARVRAVALTYLLAVAGQAYGATAQVGDLVEYVSGMGPTLAEIVVGPDPSNYVVVRLPTGKEIPVNVTKLRLIQPAGTPDAPMAIGEPVSWVSEHVKEKGTVVKVKGNWCQVKTPDATTVGWLECKSLARSQASAQAPAAKPKDNPTTKPKGFELQGQWENADGMMKLEFQSGNKCYMSMGPMTSPCTYASTSEGVTVTLDGEDMPFVANEDGSLSSKGDADAMMAVRLKRK